MDAVHYQSRMLLNIGMIQLLPLVLTLKFGSFLSLPIVGRECAGPVNTTV